MQTSAARPRSVIYDRSQRAADDVSDRREYDQPDKVQQCAEPRDEAACDPGSGGGLAAADGAPDASDDELCGDVEHVEQDGRDHPGDERVLDALHRVGDGRQASDDESTEDDLLERRDDVDEADDRQVEDDESGEDKPDRLSVRADEPVVP